MALTRDEILGLKAPAPVAVDVPGYGRVFVKSITARQRDEYESSLSRRDGDRYEIDMRDARAKLLALAVCDGEGRAQFSHEDIPALTNLPADFVSPVFDAASRLNRLSKADLKELVGNSAATPANGSATS